MMQTGFVDVEHMYTGLVATYLRIEVVHCTMLSDLAGFSFSST